MTTYRALLVANSTFPDDADNLPELEGPRNDAALLRDALCDRSFGLFASDNVRLVQERPMGDVLRELEDFLRSASRQDTLLLYYSGHGVLDQSNEFFLCAQNSRTDRLRSTAIKASDISEMINESAAATTLIFLDCCHSGRFKSGDVPSRLAGEGRFVVTSSRGGELARDAHAQNHASLFTHHLVEGLMGQAPDHDRDGLVSLTDLYDYVHDALRDAGRQVPQKRFEGSGDVPIAMRPGSIAVAEDPELLDPAAAQPVLDVSTTDIDLGQVGADEELPPERILVINRGGGTLQWKAESSADWVRAVPDETGVELHLDPGPGSHRANVYITDERTGSLKTVRIRVRVGDAVVTGEVLAVTAPVTAPVETVEPVETTAPVDAMEPPEPVAAASGPGGLRLPAKWLAVGAEAVAAVLAGWYLLTAVSLLNDLESNDSEKDLFLRGEWGVGMAESMLVALVLGVLAVVALIRRRRGPTMLAAIGTMALSMGLLRATEHTQFGPDVSWTSAWSGFGTPIWLCLAVAGLAVVAMAVDDVLVRQPSAPNAAGLGAIGLTLLWAVSLAQDVYDFAEFGLVGDHTEERLAGRTWQLVTIMILVLLVVAAVTCFTSAAARGVMLGVATVAVAVVVAEILFVVSEWDLDVFTPWRLPILLVPAAALAWWAVRFERSPARRTSR